MWSGTHTFEIMKSQTLAQFSMLVYIAESFISLRELYKECLLISLFIILIKSSPNLYNKVMFNSSYYLNLNLNYKFKWKYSVSIHVQFAKYSFMWKTYKEWAITSSIKVWGMGPYKQNVWGLLCFSVLMTPSPHIDTDINHLWYFFEIFCMLYIS